MSSSNNFYLKNNNIRCKILVRPNIFIVKKNHDRNNFSPSVKHNDEYVFDGGQGDAGGEGGFNPLTSTVKKKSYAATYRIHPIQYFIYYNIVATTLLHVV